MPPDNSPFVVYVVQERPNPSTDFFISPLLASGRHRIIPCNFTDLPAPEDLTDAVVIFVRYIPQAWLKLIEAVRPKLAKLVFFMDDDLLDFKAAQGMPWRYRFKLARLSTRHLAWLKTHHAQLWVSTPYLHQKYAGWPAMRVLPAPPPAPPEWLRVFYHGSASHKQDAHWLLPVMTQALAENERFCFEIIGGYSVNRLYKKLPRTTVVHPMPWLSYQAFLSLQPRHIGLNPLLSSPFNKARSYTKFFDITRCGAVGIYSPSSACADVVQHRHDGLVVELDPKAWVAALTELAKDELLRATLLGNARTTLQALDEQARSSHQDLL